MHEMALATDYVRQSPDYATGTAEVVLDESGQPRFAINHPAAYDFPVLSEAEARQLCSREPDLIYFGTLFQMSPQAREVTAKVLDSCSGVRRLYDVNLRVGCYTPALVHDLMSRATLVKVNEEEVATITSMFGGMSKSAEQFCRDYARKFGWEAVCVTRGPHGCLLLLGDSFVASAGYQVNVADAIGAGDAFAAALAHGIVSGWSADEIADFGNRVGALVASRPGATPRWSMEEAAALRH
jgi:fructokinase